MDQVEKYKENRVIRNSFYGVLQFVIPTLLLLGFTPVFVHKMGSESYGLWMVANSALGLMGVAEFGLNTAISKYVAEYVGSHNIDALSIVVSVGLVVQLLIGFVLFWPLYVFSPNLAAIFKSSEINSVEQIGHVIQIMSLGFVPYLLRSGALAVPVGLQRFKVPLVINVGFQILNYTIVLVVVLLGGTVAHVVGSTVVVLWISALISLIVAWQMLKPFNLKLTRTNSREIIHKMLPFAFMSGLSSLGSQIFSFVDRLAVGAVLSLEAVAYYSIIISVASKISQLSGALTGALMPAVSSWTASGMIHRVKSYLSRATVVLLAVNILIATIIVIIARPLLSIWIGNDFATITVAPFQVLIIIYALFSLNAPAYYVAYGMGKPWINALMGIIGGGLTIGLIIIWGKTYGLIGAAYANSGYLVTLIIIRYVYWYIGRIIKQNSMIVASQKAN